VEDYKPNLQNYRKTALQLCRLLVKYYGPTNALRRFKKFAAYFAANFRFGHSLYAAVLGASDISEIETILIDFFQHPPEMLSRPNMNLLL
jgi:hypothetical protein